jgi:hypothetical protein
MKVIDLKPEREARPASLMDQISGSLKAEKNGSEDQAAQNRLIAAFGKVLSNNYVLLRNVSLEGLDVPIPLILVGPSGVRIINASSQRGVYRARGETWEKLDERQQKFRPALPNLLTRTMLMGKAVQAFLNSRGLAAPDLEAVLAFSDPGLHADSVRPAVRIVLADAMERFITALSQSRILLTQDEIERIVTPLSRLKPEGALIAPEEEDIFSLAGGKKSSTPTASERLRSASEKAVLARVEKVPFSSRQWAILALFLFVNILLLAVFIMLVLSTH